MSSHWEWAEKVIAEHDLNKPFAPENGQPLLFKPGTPVIYTNDYGVEFEFIVTGYYRPTEPCSLYATGYRYMADKANDTFPIEERSLRLDPSRTIQFYKAKSYTRPKPDYSHLALTCCCS